MTSDEIRMTVLRALGEIAPEANLQRIKPEVGFRQQLDIDSMDFLNFVIALHTALGIEIPERDYPQLATLQGCINYLTHRRAPVRETVPGTSTPAIQ
jgi:acyl carrier protein